MAVMSALGQKRTLRHVRAMSALPRKADIEQRSHDVRYVPIADIDTPLRAFSSGMKRVCASVCFLGNAPNISRFDAWTGLTNLSSQVEHNLALAGGL
jgi:hypothetical protein